MDTIHLTFFLMLCLGVSRSSPEILKRKKRNWIIDSFSINEGYEGQFPYVLGQVEIEKKFSFFKIHGQGVDEDPKGILQIDKHTGVLTVHGPVDYEKYRVLKLTFQALDREKHVVDTQLGVEVIIKDANDNAPKFDRDVYRISIKESTAQGTALTSFIAKDDDSTEKFRLFDFKIMSVTPQPHDVEFYLTQTLQTGTISFKGCLDHERAQKYTVIVEAKDRGDEVQLSSSCPIIINIEDGNNHLPKIVGQTGLGRVKEGQENVLVARLRATDDDSKGTAAWRAKYQIHGEANNYFRITTDNKTNDGLLYVEKQLDFEDRALWNMTVSVENELPYHACKVVSRSSTNLWKVATIGGETGTAIPRPLTRQVAVIVEDVNEAPIFNIRNKHVTVVENVKVRHYLETFTATDPDVASANTIVYRKGLDPANWVTVESKTGKVTTSAIIDRESSFVKSNIYNVTICAVDNGKPPMTGTATLNIHITDENDNAPHLPVNIIDVCQSDGFSLANITAVDPDEDPYSGPFTFKLLGKDDDKWKIDPTSGYSVNLVKKNTVHSGHYELALEVSDLQGVKAVHNLSVTVCNCVNPAMPNCRVRKAIGSTLGGGALGIIFFGLLLLAGVLLLAFLLTCKKETIPIPDGDSEQHLMKSNIEKPGTDCKVALEDFNTGYIHKEDKMAVGSAMKQSTVSKTQSEYGLSQAEMLKQRMDYLNLVTTDSAMNQNFSRGHAVRWTMGGSSSAAMRARMQQRNSMRASLRSGHNRYVAHQHVMQRSALLKVLNKVLYTLEASGDELSDYAPHVYAEEGDTKTTVELDSISLPDIPFDPDLDLDLDSRFSTLASVCMPSERTAYRTKPPSQT